MSECRRPIKASQTRTQDSSTFFDCSPPKGRDVKVIGGTQKKKTKKTVSSFHVPDCLCVQAALSEQVLHCFNTWSNRLGSSECVPCSPLCQKKKEKEKISRFCEKTKKKNNNQRANNTVMMGTQYVAWSAPPPAFLQGV